MKYDNYRCPSCGSNLDIDLDNLKKYCAYCGAKITFDTDSLSAILIEREKTKQYQAKVEAEKETRIFENSGKTSAVMLCVVYICLAIILVTAFITGAIS
ncbi:MAG: hypothetical protein MJ093_07480 [Saccharofermentans sp.]|nr:hypothetical protein [Saccharofermentans sp.]